MPSRRKDWRRRHGPRGGRYLVTGSRGLLASKSLPDTQKD